MNKYTSAALALVITSVAITGLAGCAADTGSEDPQAPAATEASDLVKGGGVVLHNKADRTISTGPDQLTVTASAGNATAKLTSDNPNAVCTIKTVASQSSSKRTTFAIAIDYTTDSGWNGCTYEFTAPSYKSTLTVGFTVDD